MEDGREKKGSREVSQLEMGKGSLETKELEFRFDAELWPKYLFHKTPIMYAIVQTNYFY